MAEDSEKNETLAEAQPEKPSGPTAIIVRTPTGGFREALKGPDGKFVKSKKLQKKDIQELLSEFLLMKVSRDHHGKIVKRDRARIQEQFEAMHDMALNTDPKAAPAAVKAAELMWMYLFGKPSQSDKDREANQLSGVKYVVIQAPELPNPQVVEADSVKTPTAPSFLDNVEFLPTDRNKE